MLHNLYYVNLHIISCISADFPAEILEKYHTLGIDISSRRPNFALWNKNICNMKKTYNIEVDCANCAALMENATKKTEGVENCVVNFMTQKMIVDFSAGADEKAVMKNVLKACRKVEPDCDIEL